MTNKRLIALAIVAVVGLAGIGYEMFWRDKAPATVSNTTFVNEEFGYVLEIPGEWVPEEREPDSDGLLHVQAFRPDTNSDEAAVIVLIFSEPNEEFERAVSQPGSEFGSLGLNRYVIGYTGREAQLGFELISSSFRALPVSVTE